MVKTRSEKNCETPATSTAPTDSGVATAPVLLLGQPRSPTDPYNESIDTVREHRSVGRRSVTSHSEQSVRARERDEEEMEELRERIAAVKRQTEINRLQRELKAAEEEEKRSRISAENTARRIAEEEDDNRARTERWVRSLDNVCEEPPSRQEVHSPPPPPPQPGDVRGERPAPPRSAAAPAGGPPPRRDRSEDGSTDAGESDTPRASGTERGEGPAAHVTTASAPLPQHEDSQIGSLARAIADLATQKERKSALPLPEFSGETQDWFSFRAAYEEQCHRFDKLENLARLRRALKGSAKSLVAFELALGDPAHVMEMLQRKYDRPVDCEAKQLQVLRHLPTITDVPSQVNDFAIAVESAVTALKLLKRNSQLSNSELVASVKRKMAVLHSSYTQYMETSAEQETPELEVISKFLKREAERSARWWSLPCAPPRSAPARAPAPATAQKSAQKQAAHAVVASKEETATEKCAFCESAEHKITGCKEYRSIDIDDKFAAAKTHRLCFRCLQRGHPASRCATRKSCAVPGCGRSHHTLLHRERAEAGARAMPQLRNACGESARGPSQPRNGVGESANRAQAQHGTRDGHREADQSDIEGAASTSARLERALVKIVPVTIYGPKGSVQTHALLDDGATVTLMKEEIANRVGARGRQEPLALTEATSRRTHASRRVSVEIAGPTGRRYKLENARTLAELKLLTQTVRDYAHLPHLRGLPLQPYAGVTPEILIGQDNYHLLAVEEQRRAAWNEPAAVKTALGWVLNGPTGELRKKTRRRGQYAHFVGHTTTQEDGLAELVREHYKLESLGVTNKERIHKEDERALRLLDATCRKTREGDRWEAGLLWRDEVGMPPSKSAAARRLRSLEKKMDRDEDFRSAYVAQIQYLVEKGYARQAQPTTSKREWYLPHFAVTNPNKPGKLRVVFDAAARIDGRSLNDALLTGPDMLQSLLGVIFRFREGAYAVTADIKEMFLRVSIREEDRAAQRFLWRGTDRVGPPQEYEMTAMLFGAASSPATAIYIKNKNADEFAARFPRAAEAIKRSFYMDDYLQSFPSAQVAEEIASQVRRINAAGGFELTGWASNSPALLQNVAVSAGGEMSRDKEIGPRHEEKTLGMRWESSTDTLGFNIAMARVPREILAGERTPTKREMLRVVMSFFDPLGLLAPILVQAKVILQRVWRTGVGWDDRLHAEEDRMWQEWLQQLQRSWRCRVPRCYDVAAETSNIELHTFCDASEDAYAAVCYLRFEHDDGVRTALVASKSRVAPLKPTSIPRLELQAALIGSRLADTVLQEHSYVVRRRTFWTDSSTVIAWLRSDARNFKPFVSHRLGEIDELTESAEWRWVPTADNVADDATRPLSELHEEHRWFRGPDFLRRPREEWPEDKSASQDTRVTEEMKKQAVEAASTIASRTQAAHLPNYERFSSWQRLLRSTAYVLLFIDRCRRRATGELQMKQIARAEALWYRRVQEEAFESELACLKAGKSVPRTSRLRTLAPYIDEEGVLRLRGRAGAARAATRDATAPVILCGRHHVTKLLIRHLHVAAHHGSTEAVVNQLRERHWVVRLRPAVRAVEWACQLCRLRRARATAPPMGELPAERVGHHHRPFTYCGVDYFGPMDVTIGRRREKRYGALFTCLVTRAVHIELAASLTTDSAICAVRRMTARRGLPAVMYSDNGTNFRGADAELRRAWEDIDRAALSAFALTRGMEWKFIPPGAPFMGGAWERLVGSVKRALAVTLHERAPREEVLATLLAEAEHVVNSRPLTHVSVDPRDPEALTPNHFMLGSATGAPTPGVFQEADLCRRQQWRAAQRLADVFWSRWVREYLPTLQPRTLPGDGGRELQPGDFVVIMDHTLPRNVWPRGRVEKVLPGRDGHVRVVDVRTTSGTLRRPARRVIRLPVERVDEDQASRPGGVSTTE